VPTTMWISSDMRGIHAREQARLQQECDASKASRTTNAAVAAPPVDSGAMAVDGSTMPASGTTAGTTNGAADDPCAKLDGAPKQATSSTTDPNADPNAVVPVDPNADPNATAPVDQYGDPNAGMPVDSSAQGGNQYDTSYPGAGTQGGAPTVDQTSGTQDQGGVPVAGM
ncbi:MAG: hypothetical protein JWM98_129, partial [Thermoleophilia bacterium]|nr:hypothetical protein [Thermoleophilia bacterium]